MLQLNPALALWLASLLFKDLAAAAPTWPDPSDELEDIMFLQTGYRARGFAAPITPCGASVAGAGRSGAAEYIRTAFHDAATANVYTGAGGADASIMYELGNSDNAGIGFSTTLTSQAPFLSSRSSAADLIALGMYAGVRVCGGPIIDVKAGRVDATTANNPGVPQPQNSAFTFENQFLRFGFTKEQMIMLVACGHTVGGVHTSAFPQVVPPGSTPDGVKRFDSSAASFDNRIAVEYVAGNTTDPLVNGPNAMRNSDLKVFAYDKNVTIRGMTDPVFFANTCQTLLKQLIETVPGGVALTANPIVVYDVKPSDVQLTLLSGNAIRFAGFIRVRTTARAASSVRLVYKDRTGGSGGTIDATASGSASGLDDSFSFFSFSASLSATTSISSFTVLVNGAETFNNNGDGFPVQDNIIYQKTQSCVADGTLTAVAAVRDSASGATPNLVLTLKTSRGTGIPTPLLTTQTVAMTQGTVVGPYTLWSASYGLESGQAANTKFDVTLGSVSDSFKDTSALDGTCGSSPSGGGSTTTSSTSSLATSTTTTAVASTTSTTTTAVTSSTGPTTSSTPTTESPSTTSTTSSAAATSTITSTTSTTITTATSSAVVTTSTTTTKVTTSSSTASASSSASVSAPSGWTYQGCVTEATNARALTGASTTSNSMTLAACASFCAKYAFFGTEYGSECYCGNARDDTSTAALESECSMACAGSSAEKCGAGNRLSLFGSKTYVDTTPELTGYTYQGCYADTASRVLSARSFGNATSMTYELCASYCGDYALVGLEYGTECYCGDALAGAPAKKPDTDCGTRCAGAANEACGGAYRLTVFRAASVPLHGADIAGWSYAGCRSDSVGARTLAAAQLYDGALTVERCAAFCQGHMYFGTEYATECYCGDAFAAGSAVAAEGDCSMRCGGNAGEYCGAGNRLSVYAKQV